MSGDNFQQTGEGIKGWAQHIDAKGWLHKAQEEVQSLAGGVNNRNLQGIAGEAQRQLQNGNLGGIAEGVGTMMFPQAQILKLGAGIVSDIASKREVQSLLKDRVQLGNAMSSSFDALDANKNGFIAPNELQGVGGIAGLIGDQKAVGAIMNSTYSTLANLDGKGSDKGISRKDVEIFNLLQNPMALQADIDKQASHTGNLWGGITATVAAAAGFALFGRGQGLARMAMAAGIPALVGGLAAKEFGDHHERASLESFYAGKKQELDKALSALQTKDEPAGHTGSTFDNLKKQGSNLVHRFLKF